MASILDQYEASSRSGVGPYRPTMPEPIATGYVNAKLEDEVPLFTKQRINFNPPDPIMVLVASNNFLVMGMSSNILFRIDLEHPDSFDEVEIPKAVDDRIYNLYQDPTGKHLLVSMQSSENYYLARKSNKPRHLSKLKGHQVSAVGWNRENMSDTSTGEILVGTTKGLILETEIVSGEDSRFFQASIEQYIKQLYNVGRERPTPVTGLHFQKMPSTSLTEYRYFVMATTPGRLYQFLGTIPTSTEQPIFTNVFQTYEDIPERFLELPGEFGYSELHFFHPRYQDVSKAFAWMAGPGVYYGRIDVTGTAGEDSVTMDTRLIEYPREDGMRITPKAVVLTEFHVLVMFPDKLKAVCVLNEQLVFEDIFPDRFGRLLGMCKDPMKGTIWAYTAQAVFKYKIVREARDVWQMYLDKEEFELAKEFCKDNPVNMDKVLTKQADYLFKKEKYQESAHLFAQTQNSFEEVALKFIKLDNKEALKTFLLKRLATLKAQDKMQRTMLITWLIEIYLNQLGQIREDGEMMDEVKFDTVQREFRTFLGQVKDSVNYNRGLIYDLIASHGDIEDMVFYAVLMQDYERVITHHIQQENYKDALEKLKKQNDMELFYKFSPLLMQNIPQETVDAWIIKGHLLDPKRLIPALVQYDHDKYRAQGNEAIRYLENCVQALGNQDEAIHNYLLSLYSKLQPDKLLKYLNQQGQDPESVFYDLKYALRLCSEHDHKRACVHIYSTMGLYEEAVDLALQVDVDLAKQNADKPEEDEELRKKLWLRIARHVVEEEKDIKRAMEFLHECDLLKIEDILPFFPDFVTIDHFKDAICTSLHEYNQHIESLKEEMEEATESARDIRAEIQAFRNKYAFVKATEKCASCSFPLLTRGFYVFPCTHYFHNDCLISEVMPHLSISKRTKVDDLQRRLASKDHSPSATILHATEPIAMGTSHQNLKRFPSMQTPASELKEELDDIVAAECILCGDMMIRCVDKPFIEPDEYDEVMQSWQ